MSGGKLIIFLVCVFTLCVMTEVWGQSADTVASRADGEAVVYYDSLYEAMSASGGSFDQPDEITLLTDLVLDEPLIVGDGVHIRLVAGGLAADGGLERTIRRGGNIEFPVVWVKGDGASLTLGKPAMEQELIFDGGYVLQSVKAHAPLAAVSGPGAKLIMYDGVTLQNNHNNGTPVGTSFHQLGAGVFIRTAGDVEERQAEFIMKGGTIRGNVNDVETYLAVGAGVLVTGFGVFTMEGGIIMDNSSRYNGAGFHAGSRGSFKKTGGIIYGKDAPLGLRNVSLEGNILSKATPVTYAHALSLASYSKPQLFYRDDTVGEDDHLSYTGSARGTGVIGEGEKWDNTDRAFRMWLLKIILPVIAFVVVAFRLVLKMVLKKRLAKIKHKADSAPEIDLENFVCMRRAEGPETNTLPKQPSPKGLAVFTDREKEVCKLLLTELTFREIASVLNLSYSGVTFHSRNLYRKLGIQSRTELFLKVGKK